MADALNRDEEDLLQSALETAFEPAALPRVSAAPPTSTSNPSTSSPQSEPEPSSGSDPSASISSLESSSLEDSWKAEYEEHVAEWKAKNAEQRAKAEEKRKEWEEIREKEKAEGKSQAHDDKLTESGWVGVAGEEARGAAGKEAEKESPADARDLVTGEGEGGKTKEYLEQTILPGAPSSSDSTPPEIVDHPRLTSEHDSKHEKWEEVSSELTSSFPSVSFPSDPHSPSSSQHQPLHPESSQHPQHHSHHQSHPSHHRHGHEAVAAAAVSPTMAIFDSSLSKKTRIMALGSSLAINLLLPFVNGVMLGFGEIFARNVVVGWFGWKVPTVSESGRGRAGRVAATVGVGIAPPNA